MGGLTSRRSVRVLFCVALSAVILAACGGQGPTNQQRPTPPAQQATQVIAASPTPQMSAEAPAASPTLEPAASPEPVRSVPCAELGGTWTGGSAAYLAEVARYDVSACTRPTPLRQWEMVKPAERDQARWGGALCNDGTPFGFALQLSPSGRSQDWVLYLDGGAFCDDNVLSCASRGKAKSTTPQAADRAWVDGENGGIFNRDPGDNPTFHDANQVFATYCSSDAWSGATTERRPTQGSPDGWYFSGRTNVRSMVEILIERYGLDDANRQTRVLFGGTSSGGLGVEVNADTLAHLLPQIAQTERLKLLDDGGFLPDFDDPAYRPGRSITPIRDVIIRAYELWGSSLNPLCEKAQRDMGQHPGRCFLSPVVYPYINQPPPQGLGLPLMVQFSSIDEFDIELHGIDNRNDPADVAALQRWRTAVLQSLQDVRWLFSGGERPYHTISTNDERFKMGPRGDAFRELLTRFWEGGPPQRVIFGNP